MLTDVLGLTAHETATYRELITMPSASTEELASRLALASVDARQALAALERHGLAARTGRDTARYVAAPPSIALGALVVARQNEIRLAELELGSLDELYRQAAAQRSNTDVVDIVQGKDAVRQRFEQLQLGARREVLAFVKPPVIAVSAADNAAEDTAVARGVDYRVLLERSMLVDGVNTYEQVAAAAGAGEEVRVAERVPLKLVIIDRELAYVPITPTYGDTANAGETGPFADGSTRTTAVGESAEGALLVHESGLLDALVALFEVTWHQAAPLVVAASGVNTSLAADLDDLDAQVLSLLLAGLTDQAVATQLSTSLRTIQRRVRHLMDVAGADTRLQLGWHAARNGWV